MARWYTPPTICPRSGSDAPLAQAEREIANYPRAIAKGDFSLLEQALGATEQRRATIQAELAKFDGEQPSAVIQLPPRSSGITEKLRSGVHGQVRDTIQASIAWILVGVDGSLTIEARLGGLLGVEGNVGQVGGQEDTT